MISDPGLTRTANLLFRKQLLFPIALQDPTSFDCEAVSKWLVAVP